MIAIALLAASLVCNPAAARAKVAALPPLLEQVKADAILAKAMDEAAKAVAACKR